MKNSKSKGVDQKQRQAKMPQAKPSPEEPALASGENLRDAARDLYRALLAVAPSHRAPGCWCGIGRDITGYDHELSCRMARAAVAKARGEGE